MEAASFVRRRKSAKERREQRLRSETRAITRLLSGLLDTRAHRGSSLSHVGSALLELLQQKMPVLPTSRDQTDSHPPGVSHNASEYSFMDDVVANCVNSFNDVGGGIVQDLSSSTFFDWDCLDSCDLASKTDGVDIDEIVSRCQEHSSTTRNESHMPVDHDRPSALSIACDLFDKASKLLASLQSDLEKLNMEFEDLHAAQRQDLRQLETMMNLRGSDDEQPNETELLLLHDRAIARPVQLQEIRTRMALLEDRAITLQDFSRNCSGVISNLRDADIPAFDCNALILAWNAIADACEIEDSCKVSLYSHSQEQGQV